MTHRITHPEKKLEDYRKAADEALRNAARATDPDVRKAYMNIMNTWIYLADELEREMALASWFDQSDDAFVPTPMNDDAHKSR